MNFTPDMLTLVLSGAKTQTRRPARDTDGYDHVSYIMRMAQASLNWGARKLVPVRINGDTGRIKWEVGRTYAVCPGRGKKAVARMTITEIRCERAIDISEEDARAEGFANREAFFDKLRSLYGKNVDLTAPYWALTFTLTGEVQA